MCYTHICNNVSMQYILVCTGFVPIKLLGTGPLSVVHVQYMDVVTVIS